MSKTLEKKKANGFSSQKSFYLGAVFMKKFRVHFFGKNPNSDSESKNGFFVSLAKSKKGF